MVRDKIESEIRKALKDLGIEGVEPQVELTSDLSKGDYSSNVAMATFSNSEFRIQNSEFKTPMELAQKIVEKLKDSEIKEVEKVEAAAGFINFWLSKEYLINRVQSSNFLEKSKDSSGQKIMVEFAHPNTHKEMHIGHMRTLITGEALARIFEAVGAKVFRANYQGDIGPHVAKAVFGVLKLFKKENLSLELADKWSNKDKAHFLGRAYVVGNQDYQEHKEEIDKINGELYKITQNLELKTQNHNSKLKTVYLTTRQWSLDYFEDLYKRFYTKFDRLFFESEVADCGKKIVLENLGKVFEESDGAIIFKGEKYGLHNRVFVTKAGYPTYEGKDICLGFKQYEAFPFDKNIHVVASEQAGYFKVIIKALELLDPEKFKDKQYHLSMGMVQLADRKMSSRTGEVLTIDWLIGQVKSSVLKLLEEGKKNSEFRIQNSEFEEVVEQITVGAIKYSLLRANALQNVTFDIERSVSLEGDSGPYLQYTFARTQSVLAKLKTQNSKLKTTSKNLKLDNFKLNLEELTLLRVIYRFTELVLEAAEKLAPNIICNYLFDLAQKFNLFYQKHPIIRDTPAREFRLALTKATGGVLKSGLSLLGIEAPDRM